MNRNRIKKQGGFIVTIELLLLAAILVLGLIVGMVNLRDSVLAELSDLSESIGALNQSYTIFGVQNQALDAATAGSEWNDAQDTTLNLGGTIDSAAMDGDAGNADLIWNDAEVNEATADSTAPVIP